MIYLFRVRSIRGFSLTLQPFNYLLLSLFCSYSLASDSLANHSETDNPVAQLLSGPEVYKLDWNTRAINHYDIDNNGFEDLILLNNERTRIEILYQSRNDLKSPSENKKKYWQPILENSRFKRRNIVTGTKMNALALGDLNHDGLVDIAYTSNNYGLSLLFQKAQDQWSSAKHIDYIRPSKNITSLAIQDLNADGAEDLVLLGEKNLLVFYQDKEGQYKIPHRYPFADNSHFSLAITDINQDKRPDILYLAKNSHYALRVRIQNNDESFGPEQIFPLQTPNHEFILYHPDKQKSPALAYIEKKTKQLIWGEFSTNSHTEKNDSLGLPHIYPLPFKEIKSANYAIGDVNGDQHKDIIAADFKGAQVWLYQQLPNGKFSKPIAFPSFSGIQSITLADLDQDQQDELYLASKTEKLIGVSKIINGKRLSYPQPLQITETLNNNSINKESNNQKKVQQQTIKNSEPIALTHIRLGHEKIPALVSLSKYKHKQKLTRQVTISVFDATTNALKSKQTIALKKLTIDPSGIKSADINQDGLDDLLVFVLQKPAIVLTQSPAGQFKQVSQQNFRQGLLDNLKPGDLTLGDINQDGLDEILLASKGYARAIRSNAKQQLEIIEQYNAVNKNAEIESILPIDINSDQQNEILIYQQRSDQIDIFKQDENGIYRPFNSIPSGRIDVVDSMILKPERGQKQALYLGKDRFWILPIAAATLNFDIQARHEAQQPEVKYQKLASGDMNHDKQADIVVLDSQNTHIVEFLAHHNTGWKSLLHFEVFDTQSSSKNNRGASAEPRELFISDMSADGKNDLVFLVHDRILMYLGE